jgi:hypothetical protein
VTTCATRPSNLPPPLQFGPGRFHDIENLHAADGALFPTSSGHNPILTISAVGAWVGASMVDAERPARVLETLGPTETVDSQLTA